TCRSFRRFPTTSRFSRAAKFSPRATTSTSRNIPMSFRRTWGLHMPDDRATTAAAKSAPASGASLLSVRDLHAWYGESHSVHGVTFDVAAGEVVTLLGRNGAGKTTTLKSIMGVVPRREGSLAYEGHEIGKLASNKIAQLGIAWCPEERGIFSS